MALTPGTSLGTHEIVGLLGAGGMGEVYRARDTKLNRQVAIKVLPDAYASDPERVARFHREAQAVAALNHPNIATIYDLAESGATKYLVLELIEGETLADRLRRGPVPPEEALVIIKQVLEALEAAHEKGICHRDLKPANIKITAGGVVKVLDFGLAKFMQSSTAAPSVTNSPTLSVAGTIPGVILGTAGYMSPEQAKGYEADHRSDIFSVGCILYELLSGRQAFEGETASEILAGVLKSDADLSKLPPQLNPRVLELLKRCLEKNPKKRWHAAADVRVEIESLIGQATRVDPAAALPRRSWAQRWAPGAVALLGGALLAAPTAWLLKPERERTPVRFDLQLPGDQTFTGAGRNLVGVSPDGAHIVYAANNRLFVRTLSELEPREVAGTALGGVSLNPVFSPDGAQIAFWSQSDTTIKRIARGGGAAVTVCKTASVWGLDWTEHGIVFGAGAQGVMSVPAAGGTPVPIATVSAGEIASMPSLLPDGDAVVFAIKQDSQSWDQGHIVLQEIGGARTTLIEGGADPRALPTGHLLFARSGSVMAMRFDWRQRRVVGAAVPVIEGVRRGAQSPTGPTGVAHFSYSKNGVLAYLPGPANAGGETRNQYDLGVFDLGGVVKSLGLPPRDYRNPRVSPDGKFVAFHLEDDKEAAVWAYEMAGGRAPLRLTFSGRNRYPEWSADSRWVLFQSDRDGDIAIFRQPADGSGQAERLTKPEPNVVHEPLSVSPDGKYLLFSVGELRGVATTLWLLSLSDRRVQRLTDLGSTERADGAFSPDGKWLVYQVRASGGPRRVYVEPFPRTGAKYLIGEGGHPFWNGDGIIVNSGIGASLRIPFLTAPRIGVGDSVTMSRAGRIETNPSASRRNADTLPGGTQYLGIVGDPISTAASTDMVVVLDWFSDLKQRLPPE